MRRLGGLTILVCAVLAAASSSAIADTFRPTRLDDPAPGKCKPDDCSLREAVKAANQDLDQDTIVLKAETYELQIGFPDGGPFESDGLDLSTSIVIKGKGPEATTIDANGLDRPIEIGSGIQVDNDVTVQGLRLTGGDAGAATGGNGESSGGGIVDYFGKSLKLKHVLIAGNEAAFGGGVRSFADKLLIQDSTITFNVATEGGGVDLRYGEGPAAPDNRIRSSTIARNYGSIKGGGVLLDGFTSGSQLKPTLSVVNSTFDENHVGDYGAGLMADNGATATLDNTTLAYNAANEDNAAPGDGGGVFQHSGAVLKLKDSLVTANTVGTGGTGPQCAGTVTGNEANATTGGPGECPGGLFGGLSIGPLADNGGPTETIALLSGNGAIGRTDKCPATDQRGKPRPEHDCDSGAFERKKP